MPSNGVRVLLSSIFRTGKVAVRVGSRGLSVRIRL